MHPILITIHEFSVLGHNIGPIFIHTYSVMLLAAFIAGIALLYRESRRNGISTATIYDLPVYIIILSIIGSRAGYIITNWDFYRGDAISMLKTYEGGLSFHGGVIGGAIAVIYFCWRRKIPVLRMSDTLMPSLSLGLAIGRIGCFLNGCCYGRSTNDAWGIVFPVLHDGIHRHPTQLYDSAFNFAITLLLLFPLKRFNHKDGDLFAFWLILSGVTRFIMEQYRRGETAAVFWLGITMGQWVCILMVLCGIILYFAKLKGERSLSEA